MNRNILPAIVVMLGALLWPPRAEAQFVHYVDNLATCSGLVPCYTRIMDAVDAAAPSDSIRVFPGVYYEALEIVSRDNLVLRAHVPTLRPVIKSDFAVYLRSMNVQVLNFVLEPGVFGTGISTGSTIQGNLVKGSIWQRGAAWTVRDNVVVGPGDGIFILEFGNGSLIEGNTVVGTSIVVGESSGVVVRNNVVNGGGISLGGRVAFASTVESNLVDGGDISVGDGPVNGQNLIRRNVVRGGGIFMRGGSLGSSTISQNFVSGSPRDGIALRLTTDIANRIENNTSVENSGCDINDSNDGQIANIWKRNRFVTKCGAATN